MSGRWVHGNRLRLLENGEEFYPRAFEVIAAARKEVLLETFILFDDKVGRQLHGALIQAARQGAQVDVTIDGWGSAYLPPEFVSELTDAGVRLHIFDPGRTIFSWRTNMFRRMHRKILVVDGARAFVGGINYAADHLADFGPAAKQDYAVEIEGPIVDTIRRFARAAPRIGQPRRGWLRRRHEEAEESPLPKVGDAQVMFVTRDNRDHRTDIERHYRAAIRLARHRVTIANAYFFPGYRLLKDMRRAARRGVEVRLILQGEPDMPIVKTAASLLYDHLLRAGVKIYEYTERPLHGKVAVVDDEWSTVGSSNLDPLSLSLNLEANVMVLDRDFNRHLSERLEALIRNSCRLIEATELPHSNTWLMVRSFFVFHFLRHFPSWAGWLPRHAPKVEPVDPRSGRIA
jgi:cardiolipin synthase A/B